MTALLDLYATIIGAILRRLDRWFLPTFARFSFAAVLLFYFWNAARTKVGTGFFGFLFPTDNAYIQIFPKKFESVDYDIAQMGHVEWLVAILGTCAEFILPLLILIGLFTRLAALCMVGFVMVQTMVDVTGHGVSGKTLGAWFDGPSDALILDQRLLWMMIFAVLFVKGAGPISVDRILSKPLFSKDTYPEHP